jgi:release factor glutamine methyltransferase
MGLELTFEPGVFVIREETELLGWTTVNQLRELELGVGKHPEKLRIVDLGSGSGNLTCGIAKAIPNAQIWAIDIEPASIALTKKNVERHDLLDRVEVLMGDLFGPLADRGLEGSIDAVVCNPPYIASIRLQKDRAYLVENEPRAAFDGGPFGISIQLRMAKEALPFLKPGGWLLFEFGLGQERQVKQLIERTGGYDIMEFARNEKGEARVSLNRKKQND